MSYDNQSTTGTFYDTGQEEYFDEALFDEDFENYDDNIFYSELHLSQDNSDNYLNQKRHRSDVGNTDDTKHERPTNDDANHELKTNIELRGNEHCMYPYNGYITRDAISSHQLQSQRRKIELTCDGLNYKKDFIGIFTNENRFSKYNVEKIHKYIQERIDIPHFNREHRRCITLYYNNFAKYKNIIIPFIRQNKNHILEVF